MIPRSSTTLIDPTVASPASDELRMGVHSASDAVGPPTRRLCTTSCCRTASPAANDSRMYSDSRNERLLARAWAASSVCPRHHHMLVARTLAMTRITANATPTSAALGRVVNEGRLRLDRCPALRSQFTLWS